MADEEVGAKVVLTAEDQTESVLNTAVNRIKSAQAAMNAAINGGTIA